MAAFEVIALDTATPQLRAPGAADTYTFPRAVEMPLGTANGVLYLNGSKVVTSGSALTFDGTNLGVGSAAGANARLFAYANDASLPTFVARQDGAAAIQKWFAGGAEVGVFTQSGNLGIGTSSPSNKLHVNSGASTTAALIESTGTNVFTGLKNSGAVVYIGSDNNGSFLIQTPGSAFSTKMLVDTTGNVGIGTSSPTNYGATYKTLAVNGSSTGIVDVMQNGTVYGQLSTEANVYKVEAVGASTVLRLVTNGATRATLDSSGNLGLGVTPSAWGGNEQAFEIRSAGSAISGAFTKTGATNGVSLALNSYYNAGWKYVWSGGSFPAMRYEQDSGGHFWFTAPSGTAGNTITFTQAMTLDASGNLGVGTTSQNERIRINSSTAAEARMTIAYNGTVITYFGSYSGIVGSGNADDTFLTTNGAKNLIFGTNSTERARITSGGDLLVGTTTGSSSKIVKNNNGDYAFAVDNTNTSTPYAMSLNMSGVTGGAGAFFLVCADNANRLLIAGNGNVTNTNGTYGTISDAKMKTDIVDAGSQWDDLKAVRFRKFKMKDDPSGLMQLGVVAQELEQTSPGLVDEHPDTEMVEVTDEEGNVTQTQQPTGTTTKSVKTSVLLMKAAVALQEAMARIEQLEAKVAALESA